MRIKNKLNRILIRIFDLTTSVVALLVILPVFAIIAAAIKLNDGGRVFFIQDRVGRGGRVFRMFKFRSMVEGAHRTGIFIHGETDSRITAVGGLLRKTALDELPQLINVLRGEMSIIGPRPALPDHLKEYSEWQMRRLEVNPGITGWAQINGRNSLSWPERIELDIWYIENRTPALDLKIILLTIPFLLRNEGVYAGREKFSFDSGEAERQPPPLETGQPSAPVHRSVVNQ
ncbi:MAG: sugar transferase [Candidatus Latescibacteria bacterium]|nr:sugar transferase [bacterium]MBD3423634.1 sugar transferase [Candidatus Latescibacterota bacterium]